MPKKKNNIFQIDKCIEHLQNVGFYCFDRNITNLDSLCDIGRQLGALTPDVYGNIIHILEAKSRGNGSRGSFSYVHGFSSFPWHTDTAFWNIPCRYLLLTSDSANDCPTLYRSFHSLVTDWGYFKMLASKAIFKMTLPTGIKVVPFQFNKGKIIGYRYDQHIMSPYNETAKILDKLISNGLMQTQPIEVKWTGNNAIIIDNWQGIHSRGVADNCPDRKLYRLYID